MQKLCELLPNCEPDRHQGANKHYKFNDGEKFKIAEALKTHGEREEECPLCRGRGRETIIGVPTRGWGREIEKGRKRREITWERNSQGRRGGGREGQRDREKGREREGCLRDLLLVPHH